MVPAQRDKFGPTFRGCRSHSKFQKCFIHLSFSNSIIKWNDRDVSAIKNARPAEVWVYSSAMIVGQSRDLAGAGGANCARPKSCTRSRGDGSVKWCANDRNVIKLIWLNEALDMLEMGKGRNTGERPLNHSFSHRLGDKEDVGIVNCDLGSTVYEKAGELADYENWAYFLSPFIKKLLCIRRERELLAMLMCLVASNWKVADEETEDNLLQNVTDHYFLFFFLDAWVSSLGSDDLKCQAP